MIKLPKYYQISKRQNTSLGITLLYALRHAGVRIYTIIYYLWYNEVYVQELLVYCGTALTGRGKFLLAEVLFGMTCITFTYTACTDFKLCIVLYTIYHLSLGKD